MATVKRARATKPPDTRFFRLDNVLVMPHVSAAIRSSSQRWGTAMLEELERFTRGKPLRYQILAEWYDLLA